MSVLMRSLGRPAVTAIGLVALWQVIVTSTGVPPFLLPPPERVAWALWARGELLLFHAGTTALEIVLGLALGTFLGAVAAVAMAASGAARRWLLPVLVASQAVPVFALAPLLVLWLGYGLASKIGMAVLVIFFPVTAAFHDGLRRTPPGWVELARTMDAAPRAILFRVRLPAALPAFASGLRVATAVAPIGAVIGEWVGSARGLGYLMLHANGRMQTDLVFAALLVLCVMALALWFAVDRGLRLLVRWQPETLATA